jgi:hypothetical protein
MFGYKRTGNILVFFLKIFIISDVKKPISVIVFAILLILFPFSSTFADLTNQPISAIVENKFFAGSLEETQKISSYLNTLRDKLGREGDKQDKLNTAIFETDITPDLLKTKSSLWEKLYSWFREKGLKTWAKVRSILYSPIITIGTTPFSLATLIKFFITIGIGLYVLKWFKRRFVQILAARKPDLYSSSVSLITLVYYLGVFIVSITALSVVGIDISQITIILGALGVGIGFGLQTIASNFISGIILLSERAIKISDIVEVGNLVGEVKRINMRSTVIKTYDGLDIIVPNSEFISNQVTTWTYDDD